MSDNGIEVSPASAITPADFTFLEKNCDAITELMLHENHSVEVAAESPDDATGLEIREGEKGEIPPLEEQGAASGRVARNEAEID